jgi:hypothetical protein
MSSFPIGVLDDRHHVLIVATHQFVAGRDEDLHIIDFGSRLIETFLEVFPPHAHKIDRGRRYDSNHLSSLQFSGPAGVVRNVGLFKVSHRYLLFLDVASRGQSTFI